MFSYLFLYLIASFSAMSIAHRTVIRSSTLVWTFMGMLLTIMIGWRHHVGGDWNNYLRRFRDIADASFTYTMEQSDMGYQLLVYWMNAWGFDIYAVNFLSAMLFVTGLIALLRRELNPWLGLTVAIPYLIIVVSMGYTRQGVAVGLVMWGLASLDKKQFIRFLFFIALAASFHKSAVLMIAFGIFSHGKGKWLKALAVLFAGMGIWLSFVETDSADLWKNYVEAQMQSQGALIRVILNFLPALLLLAFRKQWKMYFNDYTLWFMVALASIASVVAVNFASTAVDRMALYFIPIQIIVYARLPFLARHLLSPKVTTILIVLFYGAVLLVWLNYAVNARYWLPYKNMLFMGLF
ncbi:MAG: EpsG family protein [Sulfurovum sp.]|nr:EpsG family protein [Sulfurovum sp.]